jgi:hypothetical protein
MVEAQLGTQAFWKHPALNRDYCVEMIMAWRDGRKILGTFDKEWEAQPGDIVVYGDKWNDCTFGIFLAPGRIATTIINPDCWGKVAPKMILVRTISLIHQGRNFNGGVHLG